uniref:Ig-like domain-containing protein n=1 Tax=Hippocampus comes TaxID=109280 RepID=A0A3Q2Y2X9_HIPCM
VEWSPTPRTFTLAVYGANISFAFRTTAVKQECVICSTVPPGVDHVEPMEPVTVVRGSLVTLTCEARGVPPPTLTWMKDGQPMSLHRNLLLDGQETRLQLPDVSPSEAGLYSCVASNQAGSSTKMSEVEEHP